MASIIDIVFDNRSSKGRSYSAKSNKENVKSEQQTPRQLQRQKARDKQKKGKASIENGKRRTNMKENTVFILPAIIKIHLLLEPILVHLVEQMLIA